MVFPYERGAEVHNFTYCRKQLKEYCSLLIEGEQSYGMLTTVI